MAVTVYRVQIGQLLTVEVCKRQVENLLSLFETDDTVRQQRQQCWVMNDADQRRVTGGFDQQPADFVGGGRVERCRRFVSQNEARALCKQACDRHLLSLATRQPVSARVCAIGETDGGQCCLGAGDFSGGKTATPATPATNASKRSDEYVFPRRKAGYEVQPLHHLPDLGAQGPEFGWGQRW